MELEGREWESSGRMGGVSYVTWPVWKMARSVGLLLNRIFKGDRHFSLIGRYQWTASVF